MFVFTLFVFLDLDCHSGQSGWAEPGVIQVLIRPGLSRREYRYLYLYFLISIARHLGGRADRLERTAFELQALKPSPGKNSGI